MTETSGTIGLSNLGNTCFMNACLQIFSHTHELTNALNSTPILVDKNTVIDKSNKTLLSCWKELQKLLWNNNEQNIMRVVKQFHKAFQENCLMKKKTNLLGLKQHDASEFIEFFIDGIHSALSREVRMTIQGSPKNIADKIAVQCYETIQKMYAKDYSNLIPIFFGMYISEIISVNTGKTLCYSTEPFSELTLSIPFLQNDTKVSLKQCIDLYCSSEIIRGYLNETTKQTETIQRRMYFWSLPPVLIITLKRYNNANQKNNTTIDCPKILFMSEYVYKYQSKTLRNQSHIYDLYGVCQHHGTTRGGHYTACVKHATSQKWYMYNDTQVMCIHENPQLDTILLQGAYCLFYRAMDM
jgi:ubiquitin C-terminal hydrolase